MKITPVVTHHFVKSEDLNHHGTLFAGRTAEWFVEAGLMAAAGYIPAKNIVCAKVHDIVFSRPIHLGETIRFTSKIVLSGRSSLIASIRLGIGGDEFLYGFITFVNVDDNGRPFPHGIELEYDCEEDKILAEQARALKKK